MGILKCFHVFLCLRPLSGLPELADHYVHIPVFGATSGCRQGLIVVGPRGRSAAVYVQVPLSSEKAHEIHIRDSFSHPGLKMSPTVDDSSVVRSVLGRSLFVDTRFDTR